VFGAFSRLRSLSGGVKPRTWLCTPSRDAGFAAFVTADCVADGVADGVADEAGVIAREDVSGDVRRRRRRRRIDDGMLCINAIDTEPRGGGRRGRRGRDSGQQVETGTFIHLL
jgi:hypothetical protein